MTSPKQRQMNLEWWLEYKIYWNSVLHGNVWSIQTTNMTFVGGNLNLFNKSHQSRGSKHVMIIKRFNISVDSFLLTYPVHFFLNYIKFHNEPHKSTINQTTINTGYKVIKDIKDIYIYIYIAYICHIYF